MTNIYLEKIAEMQKEAGNRLVRHIAENRESFPLSRLLNLADQGYLKTPGQLVQGRNLGSVNQLNAIADRHGLQIRSVDSIPMFAPPGKVNVHRGLDEKGMYFSQTFSNGLNTYQNLRIPSLTPATTGDHVLNMKKLNDTHIANHEAFEMDEGLRMLRSGKKRSAGFGNVEPDSESYGVATHYNPAVLMRESRDISSNPYAHVSTKVTNIVGAHKEARLAKKRGTSIEDAIESNRAIPFDISAGLAAARKLEGEDKFVSSLMGGRPYGSNPTSAEIAKSRNLPAGQARQMLSDIQEDTYGGIKGKWNKLKAFTDLYRGNSASRS
jgi:hypothetical protein